MPDIELQSRTSQDVNLRDALAAAVRRHTVVYGPGALAPAHQVATDILADPAFRAALVEAVRESVTEVLAHADEVHGDDCGCAILAAAIVERMQP